MRNPASATPDEGIQNVFTLILNFFFRSALCKYILLIFLFACSLPSPVLTTSQQRRMQLMPKSINGIRLMFLYKKLNISRDCRFWIKINLFFKYTYTVLSFNYLRKLLFRRKTKKNRHSFHSKLRLSWTQRHGSHKTLEVLANKVFY